MESLQMIGVKVARSVKTFSQLKSETEKKLEHTK